MAYVGLRKPIIGKMDENGTYEDPFAFGKAVGLTVTPNYAEGSLNADDMQAEYSKEFNYAETTLNTSTIPIQAHQAMFGHQVNEENKGVTFNSNDQSNYVGQGWISVEVVNGVRSFVGNFLKKVKYSEPNEEYATKGDSIEYKTPSITGRALPIDDGTWKETNSFKTEEEALAWIYEKFGKTMDELTVKSAEGTATGKTKLTVTPQKTGENGYVYKTGPSVTKPAYNQECSTKTGWKIWDGTEEITAKTGDKIMVVEVTSEGNIAKKAGEATVTAKA